MVLKLILIKSLTPFLMVGHGSFSNPMPLSSLASHLPGQASKKAHALQSQPACIRKLVGVPLSNHAKHRNSPSLYSSHLGPAWVAAHSFPESNIM